MVYRGKPSSACASCRARRLKCDRQHPSCSQCLRIRSTCPGYQDPNAFRFFDQTKAVMKKAQARVAVTQEPSQSTSFAASSKAMPIISWPEPTQEHLTFPAFTLDLSSIDGTEDNSLIERDSSNEPPPSAISWTPTTNPIIRNQLFSSYLADFFPQNCQTMDKLQYIISSIWTLAQKSFMLEKACSALSSVFLGKIHHDEQIMQHGLQLYNHALQYMSRAISRGRYTDDIVYTSVIFQQIQIHYCPHHVNEWIAHIDGLAAIMKYYRPKTFTTPLLGAIFGPHQKLRKVLIDITYLSDETQEWLREPNEGGALFEVIRLFSEVSRIASAIEKISASDQEGCQTLLYDCLALEQSHLDFYSQFEHNRYGEPFTYARGVLKTGIPPTDDLFGPAYHFSSLNDAIFHIMIWLSLSLLYPLLHKCQSLATTSTPGSVRNKGHPTKHETYRLSSIYVSKAARCLPYCAQEEMKSWGALYGIICAIQVSRLYSHTRNRERFLWAQNVFTFIESKGFDTAARFQEIWWNYWSEPHKHDAWKIFNCRNGTGSTEHRLLLK